MARRNKLNLKKSKVFAVPSIVGLKRDKSNAMRVGKNQINDANDFAESVDCGRPYGADGKPELDRATKKRLMREINLRRVDRGQERFVNLDGGYGDET